MRSQKGQVDLQMGQVKATKVISYVFLSLTRNKTSNMSLIILICTNGKILAFINFLLKIGHFRTTPINESNFVVNEIERSFG